MKSSSTYVFTILGLGFIGLVYYQWSSNKNKNI